MKLCRCDNTDWCQSIDSDGSLSGLVLQTGVKAALLGTWAVGVVAVYP